MPATLASKNTGCRYAWPLLLFGLAGCGSDDGGGQITNPVVPAGNARAEHAAPTRSVVAKPVAHAASSEAGGEEATAVGKPFTPPYPKRVNPFQRPDFDKLAGSKRQQERVDTQSIQLKGFVDVEGVRALLTIDGQVAALAEGEQRGGIEVISVAPPEVILQRGRLRWTESLYRTR